MLFRLLRGLFKLFYTLGWAEMARMDAWTLSTRATQPYLDILKSALIYQTHVSVPHWPLTKVAISPCLIHAVDNQVSITKLIFK